MGKKPIVSVNYKNERISIKNSLPDIKCVITSLLCGHFMGRTVNSFLSIYKV